MEKDTNSQDTEGADISPVKKKAKHEKRTPDNQLLAESEESSDQGDQSDDEIMNGKLV